MFSATKKVDELRLTGKTEQTGRFPVSKNHCARENARRPSVPGFSRVIAPYGKRQRSQHVHLYRSRGSSRRPRGREKSSSYNPTLPRGSHYSVPPRHGEREMTPHLASAVAVGCHGPS